MFSKAPIFAALFLGLLVSISFDANTVHAEPFSQDSYLADFDAKLEEMKKRSQERARNRMRLPDFSYLKPVKSNELDRYFGYQSDGFLSGAEWKIDTQSARVPVSSPLAGTVVSVSQSDIMGTAIKIHHVQGIETYLAHMESVNFSKGDIVSPGSILGYINTNAFQTVYHEVRIENVPVDPAEAIGIDLLNLKDALFEDAQKALKKQARIEKIKIETADVGMSFAAPGDPDTGGPTTYADQLGEDGESFACPEAPPGCNEKTMKAICKERNGLMGNRRAMAEEELGQPQSILDSICIDQLMGQVLNFGNIYQGTNPGAAQTQMRRALRQIETINRSYREGNFLAAAGMMVAVRNAAQAALDNMVNAINNFIVGAISGVANALTGGLFGAIFDLGTSYNCQGIAALWYTAENCFGLDVGGFLDGITLDRVELPNFGCVIESLASSYNPGFYSSLGDGEYSPYGTPRCGRWNLYGGPDECDQGR